MQSAGKAVLFGFFIWLIVFAVAFLIFPIRESNRAFFESIMPVAIAIAASFFAVQYLKKVESNHVREGLFLGILFMGMNWLIDAPLMLSPSPMQMSPAEYFQDIGFTYFMILPVTLACGITAAKFSRKGKGAEPGTTR